MEYKALIGSRCYGLELETSDVDLFAVNCDVDEGDYHWIRGGKLTHQDLVSNLHFHWWNNLQVIFPAKFLIENGLTEYIKNEREQLVLAQKPSLYKVLFEGAKSFGSMLDHWYQQFPKRAAYSTLLYDQLAKYAEGIPFAQAMRPNGDMRDKLLAMRRKDLPVGDVLKINGEAQKRAFAAHDLYSGKEDTAYICDVQKTVTDLLLE